MPPPLRRVLALLAVTALAGCGVAPEFPEQGSGEWRDKPQIGPQAGPQPQVPGAPGLPGTPSTPGPEAGEPPGPPQGCTDPDPAVVATCLDPVSAVAVLPGGLAALVAERATGRVLRVERGVPTVEVAVLAVDAAAGGLTGLVLSPAYAEDELIYAHVTTPVDGQVVRIAPGDAPKPVITGLPRAPGVLSVDGSGALLVATGGDPATPLGGRVLRTDTAGAPLPDNPDPASPVVAAGLTAPAGVCTDPGTGTTWIVDRDPVRDVLLRLVPGQPLGPPAWTWTDRPGVSGCAAPPGTVTVSFTDGRPLFVVTTGPDGGFVGQPRELPVDRYGRIATASLSTDSVSVWLGTANRAGGTPVSSDDRVVVISPSAGGSGGPD